MQFNPRDYQRAMRDFGLDLPRVNLWGGPGVGKTSACLAIYEQLRMFDEAENLLVVSTKRVCSMVWPKEVRKWEDFRHLSVAVAVGTAEERLAAIRSRANITCVNYDVLPWLVATIGEDHWPWDMVIADESSKLKGLRIDVRPSKKTPGKLSMRKSGGSERAQRLARVAHKKVRRWVNATGTPASNGLQDLWAQLWYIDAGQRLGRTFTAFQQRWFNAIKGSDSHEIIYRPTPFAKEQIEAALRDVTISINARDYMDLPQTLTNVISVPLPADAYAQYREMEREMFVEIQGEEIEAVNAGSKSMKCRQIASGAVYYLPDDGSDTAPWVKVHDAKLEALQDLVSDLNGASLLVAYQFRSDLARLKEVFPKGRYFDDNPKTLRDFMEGKFQIMFIHPASGGHGIDGMQEICRDIAFFSMTWNLEEYEQVIERIGAVRQVSAGFFRDVRVHLLVAENTIEEDMVARIDSKASVQESLKAAMKRRG
jgi:SNF2 family DNA or RNA helicase